MARVTPEQLVAELTWARTRPKEVSAILRERLATYKGKEYYPPERNGSCIVTKEGKAVVEEAIAFLEKLPPMGGLGAAPEQALSLAAEDHVADIGFTGVVSHDSSDGTRGADRALRYGRFRMYGECLWYGGSQSGARSIVLDLIVDDGVPSRGHRLGVCNPDYEVVGVAYGPHASYGQMAAFEFAAGWQPEPGAVAARQRSGPVKVAGQEEAKKGVTTQWKSLGHCALCKHDIRGGAVVEVGQVGGKMHKDCFKCAECSAPLAGVPFNVHEKVPYCRTCYFEKHGERCVACSKAIDGTMVKCALGKFHLDCVVCSKCDKPIGKNPFFTEGGVFSCQACAAPGGRRGAAAARAPAGPRAGATKPATPPKTPLTAAARAGGPDARGPSTGAIARTTAKAAPKRAAAKPPAAKAEPSKPKASFARAGAEVVGLGMDYGSL